MVRVPVPMTVTMFASMIASVITPVIASVIVVTTRGMVSVMQRCLFTFFHVRLGFRRRRCLRRDGFRRNGIARGVLRCGRCPGIRDCLRLLFLAALFQPLHSRHLLLCQPNPSLELRDVDRPLKSALHLLLRVNLRLLERVGRRDIALRVARVRRQNAEARDSRKWRARATTSSSRFKKVSEIFGSRKHLTLRFCVPQSAGGRNR